MAANSAQRVASGQRRAGQPHADWRASAETARRYWHRALGVVESSQRFFIVEQITQLLASEGRTAAARDFLRAEIDRQSGPLATASGAQVSLLVRWAELIDLSSACTGSSDHERGLRLLEQAVLLHPDHIEAHCALARRFKARGREQQARDVLTRYRLSAHAAAPGAWRVSLQLGQLCRDVDLRTARDHLRAARRQAPSAVEVALELLVCHYDCGDMKEAAELRDLVLARAQELPARQRRRVYLYAGLLAQGQRQYDRARVHFQQVLSVNPWDLRALWNLAGTLRRLGREGEAVLARERYLRAEPLHSQVRELTACLRKQPYDKDSRLQLIAAWAELGEEEEVLGQLAIADQLFPADPRFQRDRLALLERTASRAHARSSL